VDISPTTAILFLVLLGACLAIDVAGVVAAIRSWRARPAGSTLKSTTSLYLAVTIVLLVLALLAILAGALKAFGAVGGESVDPSQKARILAEGISEALNCMAFGILGATPLAIAVLVYAKRQRSRRNDAQQR
jgi:hypothetical protein